jgi:plasmid maintenance system antidote protein VapI
MQSTSAKEGTLLQKAEFLNGLGLEYTDAAQMLGTTEASLKELARVKRKKGGESGRRKKSR